MEAKINQRSAFVYEITADATTLDEFERLSKIDDCQDFNHRRSDEKLTVTNVLDDDDYDITKRRLDNAIKNVSRPTTTKQVTKYLAANGIKTDLKRGRGYFYFWGDVEAGWFSSSVATSRVGNMTFARWLHEYRLLEKENAAR